MISILQFFTVDVAKKSRFIEMARHDCEERKFHNFGKGKPADLKPSYQQYP